MIRNFLSQIMLLAVIVTVTSCEFSFLDEEMTTSLGGEQVYKNAADYEMALIGIYDMLGTRNLPTLGAEITNYLTNYNGGIILLNELATDEMGAVTVGASKQLMLEELDKCKPTAQNGIIKSVYAGQYAMINRANDLIFHAEESQKGDGLIGQYVAEAKFLRALCYYNLTSLFGGVVLTTKPGSERVGEDLPRFSTESVYELIFQDLKDAYGVLPKSFASQKQMGRATSMAAAALLARVSLTAATMGKYTKIDARLALEDGINSYEWANNKFVELMTQAKTYANKVIMEGYGDEAALLSMSYETSFYPYENTPEIIFDVQFKDGLSQEEAGWNGQIFGPGSWNWVLPTGNITNTYIPYGKVTIAENFPTNPTRESCDMRKYKNITNFQYKGDGTLWPPTAANKTYNLGKFAMEKKPDYPKQRTPINYVVLRLAEAYLIGAEADAELNNGPTDESYRMINYVRRRAAADNILPDLNDNNLIDPTIIKPIPGIIPTTKLEEFRLAVLQERMLEMVGESLRRVDLVRSGWMAEFLEYVNKVDYDDSKYIYKRRQFDDYFIFLPIPSREVMITNNLIKQNAGY